MSEVPPCLRQAGRNIIVEGNVAILTPEARRILNRNASRWVTAMGEQGIVSVRVRIRPKSPTYQTRAGVEVHRKYDRGLWGEVRMQPGLTRTPPPHGSAYSAERVPYIIAGVLESGRYAGHRTSSTTTTIRLTGRGARVRKRTTWQRGVQRQRPLWMFRDTLRMLKARAVSIADRVDLIRGLT